MHATIAGVALGLLTPARPFAGTEVIEGLERRLHPWSSFVVIPIFAVANAGVHIDADAIGTAFSSRIAWGVVVGLVVGKPLGIMLATALGVKIQVGRLPEGVAFPHLLGAACVAGIGFTVSLFVADLSFAGAVLSDAKIGIVAGSVVSGMLGGALFLRARAPNSVS